jgi:hypothetical protein
MHLTCSSPALHTERLRWARAASKAGRESRDRAARADAGGDPRFFGDHLFPHLRWHDDILALRQPTEAAFRAAAHHTWADPQFLLRYPDEADEWPPDAARRRALALGEPPAVPLHRRCRPIPLPRHPMDAWRCGQVPIAELPASLGGRARARDVVVMHPQLRHSSTLNRGPWIRYVVYFRLLAEPAELA